MLKCVLFTMILVIYLESIKIKRLLGVAMDTVVMHHFQI